MTSPKRHATTRSLWFVRLAAQMFVGAMARDQRSLFKFQTFLSFFIFSLFPDSPSPFFRCVFEATVKSSLLKMF